MRYIPRFDFITPGVSTSSVYTCGSVTKAPPSIGQCCINGRSEIFISSKTEDTELNDFFGSAFNPDNKVGRLLRGVFKLFIGSFLNSIRAPTVARFFANNNLLRSRLPNMLDAQRYLVPLTFSNKSAGPFF